MSTAIQEQIKAFKKATDNAVKTKATVLSFLKDVVIIANAPSSPIKASAKQNVSLNKFVT